MSYAPPMKGQDATFDHTKPEQIIAYWKWRHMKRHPNCPDHLNFHVTVRNRTHMLKIAKYESDMIQFIINNVGKKEYVLAQCYLCCEKKKAPSFTNEPWAICRACDRTWLKYLKYDVIHDPTWILKSELKFENDIQKELCFEQRQLQSIVQCFDMITLNKYQQKRKNAFGWKGGDKDYSMSRLHESYTDDLDLHDNNKLVTPDDSFNKISKEEYEMSYEHENYVKQKSLEWQNSIKEVYFEHK